MTTNRRSGSDALLKVPVYILAGGKSRRFGDDKARAEHDGIPLVVGVARTLEPIADGTTVVAAQPGAYDDLGLRTIGDVVPDMGPMGGLLTAIDDCRGGSDGWLFLAACDWVGAKPEWARRLLSEVRDGAQAVVFRSGKYQTMFALYHASIRGVVARHVEEGQLSLHRVFDDIETVSLPLPEDWNDAVNLNWPAG
jgi:molybdopterin-guanine dinucleotide biosynthesis protein A